jgi:uncharacterized protein (TIGR03086 family)
MDLNTMQQACASTERIVENVTPDHYDRATPCSEWNVRALLNHLLSVLVLGEALFTDSQPAADVGPGMVPDADLIGDDLLKSYRVGVERLLAAATGDAITRTHATPLGDMSGPVLAGSIALDVAVHGWDLATATGQDPTLDPDLADRVLGFARQAITDETRAPRIGPELPVAGDAPATDRLVAYLGRRP